MKDDRRTSYKEVTKMENVLFRIPAEKRVTRNDAGENVEIPNVKLIEFDTGGGTHIVCWQNGMPVKLTRYEKRIVNRFFYNMPQGCFGKYATGKVTVNQKKIGDESFTFINYEVEQVAEKAADLSDAKHAIKFKAVKDDTANSFSIILGNWVAPEKIVFEPVKERSVIAVVEPEPEKMILPKTYAEAMAAGWDCVQENGRQCIFTKTGSDGKKMSVTIYLACENKTAKKRESRERKTRLNEADNIFSIK